MESIGIGEKINVVRFKGNQAEMVTVVDGLARGYRGWLYYTVQNEQGEKFYVTRPQIVKE